MKSVCPFPPEEETNKNRSPTVGKGWKLRQEVEEAFTNGSCVSDALGAATAVAVECPVVAV
jgi:hypothetical protein